MHTHRTLSPLPENSSPGTAARARATVEAWRRLADRLAARAAQGLTPEIDAVRPRADVAAALASCAGWIRDAEPAMYEARLLEAAAECLAAAIASAANNAAADAEEAGAAPDEGAVLRLRLEKRREMHRLESRGRVAAGAGA